MEKLIGSFSDLVYLKDQEEVACLDSGGLDSAYILCKLCKTFNLTIHALTLDIGQEDAMPIKLPDWVEKRIVRHRINAKEEFAQEYVIPLLHAHGVYGKQHPLSASLSRPLIAKYLIKLARELGITTVLHAATPSQNSMRRFNGAIKDLDFKGRWGSPYLNDNYSREHKAEYITSLGGCVPTSRSFSVDSNLFCREFESGTLKNPEEVNPPKEMYLWTKKTQTEESVLTLKFRSGIPTHINNEAVDLLQAIKKLNIVVGSYGLGRYQGLEEGPSGLKVLEVREAPAAYILLESLNQLLNAIHTHSTIVVKSQLEQVWTREASEGYWYGALRVAIDSFNAVIMSEITGEVTFRLSGNECVCIGLKANKPLYTLDRDLLELASNKKLLEAA